MERHQKPVRVKSYSVVFTPPEGGAPITRTSEFTQVQASTIGAVLHQDGLELCAAQRLCETWTMMNRNYQYNVELVSA